MRYALLLGGLIWAANSFAQNTYEGTIVSGGLTREYRLYVPAAYSGNEAVPLLLNLHGYGSNNVEQQYYGAFQPIADTANFLIVLPNGTLTTSGERFWNTFSPIPTVDDVAFLSALIDTLQATYNIDNQRIYSTGMSNGGFMSYALACERSDRIAAIASVTGSMAKYRLDACQPTRPVPVMQIHGTADNVVPYNGSVASGFVPIPELVSAWVDFNGCNPTPAVTDLPNTSTNDGCTAQRSVYAGGEAGSTVEHYRIDGGGHTWPGSFFTIGVTNRDFDASREIWRFFSQYTLSGAVSSTAAPSAVATDWSVVPNPAETEFRVRCAPELGIRSVAVFDAFGGLKMRTTSPAAADIRVDVAGWPVGCYFVTVETAHGISTKKMVKN